MADRYNSDGVMENFVKAVERCIPKTSLPMNTISHEDLACELVIELSGTVCLVDKKVYDNMIRQLEQLRRYELAIINGRLASPFADLQPYVIPDPFKN